MSQFRHVVKDGAKPIGSDFILRAAEYTTFCSECDRSIPKGELAFVSIRNGKIQKRVCSEDCRLEFDARYWQERAAKRRKP